VRTGICHGERDRCEGSAEDPLSNSLGRARLLTNW
jgi:hypothetical protein